MLPLCMFSKAIGAHVEAYRIRGDPVHFPGELIKKSIDLEFNVVLFPWRPASFVEQMFWGAVQGIHVPIALLVQSHLSAASAPEGLLAAGSSDAEKVRVRVRAGSDAEKTSRARGDSNASNETEDDLRKVRSNRSASVASIASGSSAQNLDPGHEKGTPRKDSVDSSDSKAAMPSPSGLQRVGHLIAGAPEAQPCVTDNVQLRSILVLIAGAACDALLLPFVLRCAGSQHLTITVAICADTLSDNLHAAISSLKHRLRRGAHSNVTIGKRETNAFKPFMPSFLLRAFIAG